MAPTPSRPEPVIADMVAARRRSAHYGLDPAASEIPHLGEPHPAAESLTRLSAPVLDELLSQLADTSMGAVLADRRGCLTRRDAATPAVLAAMDDRSLDVGYSLAETKVGTNGVGTSLETRRPAIVVGDDHYLECFKAFTCANAPILHPVTRRVEGSVGVVCPVDDTGPLLLPTAVQLSAQISQLLLEQATSEERFLLEHFLRRRRSPRNAIATIGQGVLIATPAAQRLLAGVDQAELWEHVRAAIGQGRMTDTDFESPSSPPLRLRCQPLFRGGELGGATVELAVESSPTRRTRQTRHEDRLGDLVGASDRWRAVVREALQAARLNEPVLVVGERGTGRLSIAEAIAQHGGTCPIEVFDSAEILIEGAFDWVLRARDALVRETAVVLRRVDQLPDDVAATLASVIASAPDQAWVIATTETTSATEPGLAALLDRLNVLQIEVPPLRNRRDDIPPLVHHFTADRGHRRVDPHVISVLYRQSWPGNVIELRQTLRSARAKAAGRALTVQHLPRHIRQEPSRKPLHGLRQQEADAIVAAITSTATRTEAAKLLGISRATLYRRIDAYGLDPDRH